MQSFQRKCKFGYAHTLIHTEGRGTHIPCSFLIYIFFPFFSSKQRSCSHGAFSRVNFFALKKSKLEREQESGVNGVSLKKLSFSLPLYSALFLPRILIPAVGAREGEMTGTLWTYVSGRRVSSGRTTAKALIK